MLTGTGDRSHKQKVTVTTIFEAARNGAEIWCGHGIFTRNLVKIGALTA